MRALSKATLLAFAAWAPASARANPVQLITNGGFEDASGAPWVYSAFVNSGCDTQWTIMGGMMSLCVFPGISPFAGANALHSSFDGSDPRTNLLTQTFTLPVGSIRSAQLTWFQALDYNFTGTQPRVETVRVMDSGGASLTVPYIESRSGSGSYPWTSHTADLTPWFAPRAGQPVSVRWELYIPEMFMGPGDFQLDEVSVAVEYNPVITTITVPAGVNEASTLSVSAAASDPGDVPSYTWSWGDGTPNSTGANATHAYADNAVRTVTLTVTDGVGNASTTRNVNVANVAPVITAINVPSGVNEGASVAITGVATDASAADTLTYAWQWGDGTPNTPASASATVNHVFPDNGSYAVRLTVTDDDGGSTTSTKTVVVANVAPQITSTAPTTATEGSLYSYTPVALDPGADTTTWALLTKPAAATISPTTGAVAWTPTYADALAGTASFTLTATDDDGAQATQSFVASVKWKDADNDNMPDTWEITYALDPAVNDALLDADADGIRNIDEYTIGQNPSSFDGPSSPATVAPLDGEDVAETSPQLLVDNATDPQDDVLTYTFEVYADETLSTLVASTTGVVEGSGQTEWFVTDTLDENVRYWWHARARDAHVEGPWSDTAGFRVNVTNEPPSDPIAVYPVDETIGEVRPTLEWTPSVDPEGDSFKFDVEVLDEAGIALVTSVSGLNATDQNGTWLVDEDLPDATYTWRVSAVDTAGARSAWDETKFTIATDVLAPEGVAFTAPLDGARIESLSPTLIATEGLDPEGHAVSYLFEVDTDPSFVSSDYESTVVEASGDGTVEWDLAVEGIELPENGMAYARVRGIDVYDHASQPDTIAFYVIGENEPPTGLVLIGPLPGSLLDSPEPYVARGAVDPEGTDVTYEIIVATDEALTDVIEISDPVTPEAGDATWSQTEPVSGVIYWSARATDADGVASAWAPAWRLTIEPDSGTDTDGTDPGGKCGCGTTPTLASLWPLLAGLALIRRRR